LEKKMHRDPLEPAESEIRREQAVAGDWENMPSNFVFETLYHRGVWWVVLELLKPTPPHAKAVVKKNSNCEMYRLINVDFRNGNDLCIN